MTAPTPTTEAAEYVLVKRGLYWCPLGQGYTGLLAEAGRYSAAEASRYSAAGAAEHERHGAPSTRAIHISEAGEFSPACQPETKIRALSERLAAAEADRDRLSAELATARAEGEALRAERDEVVARADEALRRAIRAWSARLHIPVTRMMSRELRTEFRSALAQPEQEGQTR